MTQDRPESRFADRVRDLGRFGDNHANRRSREACRRQQCRGKDSRILLDVDRGDGPIASEVGRDHPGAREEVDDRTTSGVHGVDRALNGPPEPRLAAHVMHGSKDFAGG